MKIRFGAALIGATLLAGCSSSSKETRSDSSQTAASESVRGTAAERAADVPPDTAPGAPSSPGIAGASTQRDTESVRGSAADRGAGVPPGTGGSAQVSPGVIVPSRSASESPSGSPADRGASLPAGTAGNAPYNPGLAVGSGATKDPNVRWANGRVARIDRDGKRITVQSARDNRSITLIVDEKTEIVDRSGSMANSLSSLQEGQEVRAAFDPSSNHADRIEVLPKSAPADQK